MNRVRFFLLLSFCLSAICHSQEVMVMTYNIKYDNKKDTVNNWNDRKAAMVELLKYYDAEFMGMQEVLFNQLNYLDDALVSYDYIGVGRDDGKEKGEFSPIFFKADKYRLLQSNTFWLSETPEKISVGWDAALERICTYGLFENIKTKKQFWVFNTHFDHRGDVAREKSVDLIVKKIGEINTQKLPVVLMGDFNLSPETKPIQLLKEKMDDALEVSKTGFYGPVGTFNGFDQNAVLDRRIDYIFVKGFKVEKYRHLHDRMANNKYISDHIPVLVTLNH